MQRGLEGFLLRATASRSNRFGQTSVMPYLPITLTNENLTVKVMGLLDTGASVNVLPYEIGLELGAVWEEQTVPIQLSGNLSRESARGLVLSGKMEMMLNAIKRRM